MNNITRAAFLAMPRKMQNKAKKLRKIERNKRIARALAKERTK